MDCQAGLVGPELVSGIILGFIYALIALGYTMVYGVLKLINFAHDSIFMFGGVAAYFVFGTLIGVSNPFAGLGLVGILLAVLLMGGIAAGAYATVVERMAYRPLRRRHGARLSFLISAIGMSFFATYLMQQGILLGPAKQGFPNVMDTGQKVFSVLGGRVNNEDLLIIVAAVVCLIVLDRIINHTYTGRSIRALSEDTVAAQLMGISIDRVIVATFVIGGFFGGVAGALYGIKYGNVAWNMGFVPGIKAFVAAVLGGIGNIRGAMLGGLLLGIIENMSVVCFGSQWTSVVAYIVLPLVLMFRPTGLLGERIGG